MAIAARVKSVRADVKAPGSMPLRYAREELTAGIANVLDAAIPNRNAYDPRQGILTVVYNYETQSFEIRWDLAK